MKINSFCFTLCLFLFTVLNIKAQKVTYWSELGANDSGNLVLLNYANFSNQIKGIPKSIVGKRTLIDDTVRHVSFPTTNGKIIKFKVMEHPVMSEELGRKYPLNRSFKGISSDDPSIQIRFSISKHGLHAMIIYGNDKIEYIDPVVSKNDDPVSSTYQVYDRKDLAGVKKNFNCLSENLEKELLKGQVIQSKSKLRQDLKLRTYRLALAASGEYSQYHIGLHQAEDKTEQEQREIIMDSFTAALTRINFLFEKELSVKFELVDGNDTLIFLDPEQDPYTGEDIKMMPGQNQTTCDRNIGSQNYDIGHVFGSGENTGRASLAVVCNDSQKARGVSWGLHPTGDYFYFDVFAHELGHQLGATHTFNADAACVSERWAATAVEPGSGTTIMAYAGYCSPQDIQQHSDLYFHAVSLQQMWAHISQSGGSCAEPENIPGNNYLPISDAGEDIMIPVGTPFKLVGQGKDEDGDLLTYSWEQNDPVQNNVPPNPNDKIGTMFRSFPPSIDSVRYFPSLKELRNGNLSGKWEVIPTTDRDFNFSLTVRDNNLQGGQYAIDKLFVEVTDAAGPFKVISQNTEGLRWDRNSEQLIEWDVAGTNSNGNGVDVQNVSILLSVDGGFNYTETLLESTENDGSARIRVPDIGSSGCYVMVAAKNHYFFAINQTPFSIGEQMESCTSIASNDTPISIPDFDLEGIISTIEIQEDFLVEELEVYVRIDHDYVRDLSLVLESPDGTEMYLLNEACDQRRSDVDAVFKESADIVFCKATSPAISGAIKPSESFNKLKGTDSKGVWKLRVSDLLADDMGILSSWSLKLCGNNNTLNLEDLALENFRLFPNPSQGSFEIGFKMNNEKVQVSVYNLLGQKIFNQVYLSPSDRFQERISLPGNRKGIYLVQIQNGHRSAIQKIIIQ